MKKRGLVSLIIVCFVAIASVIGVIFAFQNSGRQTDVYGDVSIAVDKNDIKLEVELEKDTAADKKFRIVETSKSSTYFTITVGGLPDTADRSVDWNNSSISSGVVSIQRVTPLAESGKTGINTFKVTGQNGGAPVNIVFTSASGAKTVSVKVTVSMIAKDMKIGTNAHFGIRQGGVGVNLKSDAILSKYDFYAHPDDNEHIYTPNKFPVEYRLKRDYSGVILDNDFLTVTDQATCVDQYIDLQVKLPAMDDWLDVPFYVFPKATKVITTTDAYKAPTTSMYENVWDLIANREEQSGATFTFALDQVKTAASDYGFKVESADTKMVRVDYLSPYERSLSTVQNLGEVAVRITAYPIIKDLTNNTEISFADESDVDVQIVDTIYLRVRYEFYGDSDVRIHGDKSYNLAPSKKTVDAFFYEGKNENNINKYYDTFTLDTGNGKTINMDSDIQFELVVEDSNGNYTGIYDREGKWIEENGQLKLVDEDFDLYSILNIGYWSKQTNKWVMLSQSNYSVNYLNTFGVALTDKGNASNFIGNHITSMVLRAKSIEQLSIGGNATCDINLDVTSAIDKFKVENLTKFDDGTSGVALVYNTKYKTFSTASVDVYGMVTRDNIDTYSEFWNTTKVSDNSENLPFEITCDRSVPFSVDGVAGYYHLTYTFTASDIAPIQYYKDYPMTIRYTNGKSYTFNVRVFPTVEALSMSVVSNSQGKVYQTISNSYNSTYDYVRTVYVRKGYDYQFAIDTPSVSVGAYAIFDEIKVGNQVIATNTRSFNAIDLSEGIYTCTVSLHAYSEEVYHEHQRTITVYMIVVDPVINVVTQPAILNLDGIGCSREVELKMYSYEGVSITDYTYLHIDIAQKNENVLIESQGAINKFRITAKYLTDGVFDIGFKVYKNYIFTEFDLDGDGVINNELPFEFNYMAGALVSVSVSISETKPNTITISGNDFSTNLGNYVELISTVGSMSGAEINVKSADDASNKNIGIAYAEWKNGKYELSPFAPVVNGSNLQIGNVATACVNSDMVTIDPLQNVTDMGSYALVIYTRDSLYYVDTNNNVDLVLPKYYKIVRIFVGSAEEVTSNIAELTSNHIHDANSGKRNNLGGYNWIIPAKENSTNQRVAVLFYTTPRNPYGSQIDANVYYFDDLYSVLGWGTLKGLTETITLEKYVKVGNNAAEKVGAVGVRLNPDEGREGLKIDLNHKHGTSNDEEMYSHGDVQVYYQFSVNAQMSIFYVVEGIDNFDVRNNRIGLAARRTLSPEDENNHKIDTITVQRGTGFNFNSNLNQSAGWQLNKTNFTTEEEGRTSYVTYDGGTYSFFPYIQFTRLTEQFTFELDALTANVKVDVKGGINYLNIVQNSVSLDGVTTATYDVTMRIDQENWKPSLLTYNFSYDGVYYDLFADDTDVSYINLEGGKSKLEFKLTCLNANTIPVNGYYTYYLRIEVAVVIIVPDVDPFYNIPSAELIIRENLVGSPLSKVKTPAKDSATLSLMKDGINNVTMAHFANTNVVEGNRSLLTLATGQTDSGVIYLDNESAGGLLVIYPTPYYINVSNISLSMASNGAHIENVEIGTDLTGKPIYDKVTYTVGFTQMIYNETEKYYQPYLSGTGTPKMVSSWSAAEGYKWTGKYYFRTYIVSDAQVSYRLPDGTRFKIQISIQGERTAKAITETMTLDARYRDSFVITPDSNTEDYAVRTMAQTRYQAVGTTAVYDVALPIDCVPNYAKFTLNGTGSSNTTIHSTYADVTINSVDQTLSVYIKADNKAIGQSIEIRIPYRRPGDYVNPYFSIVIVPVYFEFDSVEVIDHYETRLQLASKNALAQLKYRALFNYNTSMSSSALTEKMRTFNESLLTSSLISRNYETPGQIDIQIPYTYVNGVPVLTKNGEFRYAHTFYYDIATPIATIKRTEYLAVGTAETYTFYNWDPIHASRLYLQDSNNNTTGISDYWYRDIKSQDRTTVLLTVSLENRSSTVSDSTAYSALINAGRIVVYVYSTADQVTPQLELTIIPVYFTFDEFKLQNNPAYPLVALTTPSTITVEAGNISAVNDTAVNNAINTFNTALLNAQNNLSTDTRLSFNRIPNDDGILNFNFDNATRALTRADSANPITATSYLLITAGITYVNGIPTLNSNGQQISTYIPVNTFGAANEGNNSVTPVLDPAPNGRVRTIAQAIGTKVRYNIALPGVVYDSALDKYEIRADGNVVWENSFAWNAVCNVKENTVLVTLNEDTSLFNKVLSVMAYNQAGDLMYVLNIVPAYFTVEQLFLSKHVDENPVLIKNETGWLQDLDLDFVRNYSHSYNFDTQIAAFKQSLNISGLVSRIDDAGYITLIAGVDYEDGIPTLVNVVNGLTTVQNVYRYELVDGTPENTKAQAIGQTVIYNVNRVFESIKIGTNVNGNEVWNTYDQSMSSDWAIERDGQNKIKVILAQTTALLGNRIRIGVFVNDNDEEPSYVLNVIPAYFVVEDLTVAGQNSEDRNIFLYYGEDPDSPLGVKFDAIFGEHSLNSSFEIPQKKADFIGELQNTKANLIGRYYDRSLMSGDLHITLYLDYTTGIPTIIERPEVNGDFVVRLDVDFWYAIFGRGNSNANAEYLPLPVGPRTRTEVQAIGTTVSYTIDLSQTLSADMEMLSYNESILAQRGWKASFVDNVLTLNLLPSELPTSTWENAIDNLLNEDIVFNFYSGSNLVFVLTIQPVLFEVIGVDTDFPEQPIYLDDLEITEISYRAKVKYNDQISYNGKDIVEYIKTFNTQLNAVKGGLFNIEDDGEYLKLDIAIDYGAAGSNYRQAPKLLNTVNNPLNVIESYVKYSRTAQSNVALHYQAVGTTEYYYLGAGFAGATINQAITNVNNSEVENYITAEIVNYGGNNTYALKVVLKPNQTLVEKQVTITINNGTTFTMTIQPVWFLVEGFEVVNHPERHMWLINSNGTGEKVGDLLFCVRAHYSTDSTLFDEIQNQINAFNLHLAKYENNEWVAKDWDDYLVTTLMGKQYLIVSAAINYDAHGVANIVSINSAEPTAVVRDVFEYAYYADQIKGNGIVYPNVPRNRMTEITVGTNVAYTIDVPDLTGFTDEMIAVYENSDIKYADDDSKLQRYTGDDITVQVTNGNHLQVALKADAELVHSEFKIFIYYDRAHVNNTPNSSDADNVAFILVVRPVLFKVTGFALPGYNDDTIYVDDINQFTNDIASIGGNTFVPVYEYADSLLNEEIDTTNHITLQTILDDFTNTFLTSKYAAKTRTRGESTGVYYFQVMTSVAYNAYQGTPYLTNDPVHRVWQSFKVVEANTVNASTHSEYQAVGTIKTYYINDAALESNLDDMFQTNGSLVVRNGSDVTINSLYYDATWSKDNPNYINVLLLDDALIGSPVNVEISSKYTLQINPVYYEILGFEPVEHPERSVWVVEPYSTNDLQYRVITSDLTKVPSAVLSDVQNHINSINESLNNGVAPKSITFEDNQYIIFGAAVNYNNGYPEFTTITKDKRNVVESVIDYRVWSANKKPNPEHPAVMGKVQANQIIGKTKLYTLKNIKGQIFYQYLWAENAGNLLNSFDNSTNGTMETYEKLTILVDTAKNTLQIQLSTNSTLLSNPVRVYIPYLTTVNGKDVWYSYCIEITPLLFELKGWTIKAAGNNNTLISDQTHDDYLLLTTDSEPNTLISYVAHIETCETNDLVLQNSINNAKSNLENEAVNYMIVYNPHIFIGIDGLYLKRNCSATTESNTAIGLSTYVVYENGLPRLVENSNTLVSNQILISTGYSQADWENNKVGKELLAANVSYAVQALGTATDYSVEIASAARIFHNDIKVVEQGTDHSINIEGERENLITVEVEKSNNNVVNFNVSLAPVVALRNYMIEIQIPYSDDVNAIEPNYVYKYYITPTVFIVEGFYLAGVEDNNVELNSDITLDLRVQASYSDNVNIRNVANLLIQNFENSLNNAIRNETPVDNVIDNETLYFAVKNNVGSINVELKNVGNRIMIHKSENASAVNSILGTVKVGYATGAPRVGSVNPLIDTDVNLQIQITTEKIETIDFPGYEGLEPGYSTDGNEDNTLLIGARYMQAIGTSCNYPLHVDNRNISFAYDYIKVFNGGLESGVGKYECFDINIVNNGANDLIVGITFTASAKNLNDFIDVRIPFTILVNGEFVWAYYSLQIKPVLFEVVGWKLKIGNDKFDSVTLNENAVVLCFTPEIKTGSTLNSAYYAEDELAYIERTVKSIETRINTFDSKSSDDAHYPYLTLKNTPQEGHQVNYVIERYNYRSYLTRRILDASTTVLTVSGYVSYDVGNVNQNFVDSSQIVTSYSNNANEAQVITSSILIHTTDKTFANPSGNGSNGGSTGTDGNGNNNSGSSDGTSTSTDPNNPNNPSGSSGQGSTGTNPTDPNNPNSSGGEYDPNNPSGSQQQGGGSNGQGGGSTGQGGFGGNGTDPTGNSSGTIFDPTDKTDPRYDPRLDPTSDEYDPDFSKENDTSDDGTTGGNPIYIIYDSRIGAEGYIDYINDWNKYIDSSDDDDDDDDDDNNGGNGNGNGGVFTAFIKQNNANVLMSLQSGVRYVLMEDIVMYNIPGLRNGRWQPVDFPSNTVLDGNNYKIIFNSAGFDLTNSPANIGMFTSIPADSVIMNLQIVIERGSDEAPVTTLEVNLANYTTSVNVGLLAGVNNGVITNCAVLSQWQFNMRDLNQIINPITGKTFTSALPFNKDGYLFEKVEGVEKDYYFYELGIDSETNKKVVKNVYRFYDNDGQPDAYRLKKDEDGVWVVELDDAGNKYAIDGDTHEIAQYDDYSPMIYYDNQELESVSPAKLFVKVNNENVSVVLGGLVGSNSHMITNSRVLIDIELYGPGQNTGTGNVDQVNVLSSIVGGVVGSNSGTITSTFFRDGNVVNNANAKVREGYSSLLGGFVGQNTGIIQQSYAMGRSVGRALLNHISEAGAVRTIRNSLGGFVHLNSGTITDCLVNMVIVKTGTEGAAGGFVYKNTAQGVIKNCIENNNIITQSGNTLDFYRPFVCINGNGDELEDTVNTANLSNLIYAGNAVGLSISDEWNGVLKGLLSGKNNSDKYDEIKNYEGYSIGTNNNSDWGISAKNTIWMMTTEGPMLRAANDIVISCRNDQVAAKYLYELGSEKNPYLIWNKYEFENNLYHSVGQATESDKNTTKALTDIENNYQNNHIRLIDNISISGIRNTYKIIYRGTFEGNGLTFSGINLSTVTNDLATMGLFGKTEYATFRNVNFEIDTINSTARYVGGIAGIAINTSFVDVSVKCTGTIKGANIVGGFVGLNVVCDYNNEIVVENYNLYSSVSVTANFQNKISDVGANSFSSGEEYCRQTLYAKVEALNISYEQGYGAAGGVFGFVTSNPNNYRYINSFGQTEICSRFFNKTIEQKDASGKPIASANCGSYNSESKWFLKDINGQPLNELVDSGSGEYFYETVVIRNVSGAIKNVAGNVAGGLIGIMDETIELQKPVVESLASLTGKYYLGGLVGINLGKITGGEIERDADGNITSGKTYNAMALNNWTVASSAGENSFVFRKDPAEGGESEQQRYWGMTVGGAVGYNGGFGDGHSGVVENINISANVLAPTNSKYQYVIGGVVGTNGKNGLVTESINTHTNINNSTVQVTSYQAQNVGFYFGRIVGRSETVELYSNNDGIKYTRSLQIEFPANMGYVSATDFATPGLYTFNNDVAVPFNQFGVVENSTRKIQTMVYDEYLTYLSNTISNKDLVTRIEMLEPWVRSLPTKIDIVYVDGANRFVEKYDIAALKELTDWLDKNNIFNRWNDTAHNNALTTTTIVDGKNKTSNKVIDDYKSYLAYSAVSTVDVDITGESEKDFTGNLDTYRTKRQQKAIEFFTYKYEISKGISGAQNADFNWNNYENYLALKREIYTETGDDEIVQYVKTVSEDGKTTVTNASKVAVNSDLKALLATPITDATKFSNVDPLQVYINYAVNSVKENSPFNMGGNGWSLSLTQYYYYMRNLYGKSLEYKDDKNVVIETYNVPNDFAVTNVGDTADYVLYLYTNDILKESSNALTIPEFIYLMKHETAIVTTNETKWIKTGHKGNGDARISSIGAVELNWVASLTDLDATKVKSEAGVISYIDTNGNKHEWEALSSYLTAKENLGLMITKYQEMVGLGGTLYDLIDRNTTNDTLEVSDAATDNYIFALKCKQYGWTEEQIEFIKKYYATKNANDAYEIQGENLKYALSATTYGNVLSCIKSDNNNYRAVYVDDKIQVMSQDDNNNNSRWYSDIDADHVFDTDEPSGVWSLPGAETFTNGDGKQYQLYNNTAINLMADVNNLIGAALYIDTDNNKMFGEITVNTSGSSGSSESNKAGKDILLIYELTEPELNDATSRNYPDFFVEEKDKDNNVIKTRYYKIARQVINDFLWMISNHVKDESGNVEYSTEHTNNFSDYLEEALWWRQEGFTAEEFDKIKAHAIRGEKWNDDPKGDYAMVSEVNANGEFTVTRTPGSNALVDDWNSVTEKGLSGFKNDSTDPNQTFTTAEYTEIVLGAEFVPNESGVDTWYSNYGDYLLFKALFNGGNVELYDVPADNITGIVSYIPDATTFKNPFDGDAAAQQAALTRFTKNVAAETELAPAMTFGSDREAFMELFRAHGRTADYFRWAQTFSDNDAKYFTLNHYIYYVKAGLADKLKIDGVNKFNGEDYRWVLNRENRRKIQYNGATEVAITSDLVEYCLDWYNDGNPFMTFRNYYEWINIYKYDDNYKQQRGEYEETNEEGETETKKSDDGWLTIEAYAVWKRMEKYENNIEYYAKKGSAASEDEITTPILNRKISTTVFPRVHSSGEQVTDPETGTIQSSVFALPLNKLSDEYKQVAKNAIGWNQTDDDGKRLYPNVKDTHIRPVQDRYEYNELYKERTLTSRINDYVNYNDKGYALYGARTDTSAAIIVGDSSMNNSDAKEILNVWTSRYDLYRFRKTHDEFSYYDFDQCTRDRSVSITITMGPSDYISTGDLVTIPNRYDYWGLKEGERLEEYGKVSSYITHQGGAKSVNISTYVEKAKPVYQPVVDYDKMALCLDEISLKNEEIAGNKLCIPENKYAQLYIPFDTFEEACTRIKRVFSDDPEFKGYHNYMKFWARNGDWNWISFYQGANEYDYKEATATGIQKVEHTYESITFWTNYDGTKSPLDGTDLSSKAYSWKRQDNQ